MQVDSHGHSHVHVPRDKNMCTPPESRDSFSANQYINTADVRTARRVGRGRPSRSLSLCQPLSASHRRTSAPQLLDEPPARLHLLEVLGRALWSQRAVPSHRAAQRLDHVAPHQRASADVHVAAALQHRPQLGAVVAHQVLHVHLGRLCAREGEPQPRQRARGQVALELLSVDVVLLLAPAAKVEPRGAGARLGPLVGGHLLQEGAEGRDAGARPDHDHGRRGVLGERKARRSHEDDRRVAGCEIAQLRRADAHLGAPRGAATHRLAQHLDREVHRVGRGRGRGGDRVVARRELGHELEQRHPWRLRRREGL
eukprot:scaffold3058_cov65-Phaeocystis_antarctica.AAC.10